jgi:hypothetical protein
MGTKQLKIQQERKSKMNKKFLTLLTGTALTMVLTGAVSAAQEREAEGGQREKLSVGTHEYALYEATLRFRFFMKEDSQPAVEKKISSRFIINEMTLQAIKEQLDRDKINGFRTVPNFLKELNRINLTYLQTINPDTKKIDSSYIYSYQQTNDARQLGRYAQKAMVGYTFTLSKEEKTEAELRWQNLTAIAAHPAFSEKRRSFASYGLIEQKAKLSINTITGILNDKVKFDKDSSAQQELLNNLFESYQMYSNLLKKRVSHTTQVSIQYHIAEINYLVLRFAGNDAFEMALKSFEQIKQAFQAISADAEAHGFTKALANKYLTEKPLS